MRQRQIESQEATNHCFASGSLMSRKLWGTGSRARQAWPSSMALNTSTPPEAQLVADCPGHMDVHVEGDAHWPDALDRSRSTTGGGTVLDAS